MNYYILFLIGDLFEVWARCSSRTLYAKQSWGELNEDIFEALNQKFAEMGVDTVKIRCFSDRFAGMSFADMAKQNGGTPDKYRKYFKRLIKQIIAE